MLGIQAPVLGRGKNIVDKPPVTDSMVRKVRRHLPDDAEHVDVGVISGEVDEEHSGPSVQPQVVQQVLQDGGALLFGSPQVLIVSRSAVCGQQAPVGGTFDLFLCVVAPAAEMKLSHLGLSEPDALGVLGKQQLTRCR